VPLFRIARPTIARLVVLPESGLGYQVLHYRGDALVVFNATLAIPLNELRERRFTEEDYAFLSGDPERNLLLELESLELGDDLRLAFSLFERPGSPENFGLSSPYSVVTPPDWAIRRQAPRAYYRFCAYYRDRRVDPVQGSFLPGTYATTHSDMHFVPSGFAAVGRYALPNPASARFVFQIVTYDHPSLMGTATPNFGQAGGGVEVFFANGASNRPGSSFPIYVG
jgi:hypothetical protein